MTEQTQEVETSKDAAPETVRESIERAFETAEKAEAEPEQKQEAAQPERTEPAGEASPQVASPPAGTPPETKPAEAKKPEGEQPAAEAQPEKPASIKTEKAPQSWTPSAREKWATLPGEVRAEVQKREREIARAMQETAEDRKAASTFRQTVAPYEGMLRSENVEPVAAVDSLLRTYYALRTGPPQHKAAIVASIIQGNGVDPSEVAKVLSGQAPVAQAQSHVDPNAIAAQVEQRIRAEQAQREQQQAMAKLEQFADSHEFFTDVAGQMQAIMAAKQAQGLPVDLEDVYNLACQVNPDVSGHLKQREAAAQAKAQEASTQRARAAASSVRGSPAGTRSNATPEFKDLRSTIEWAAEQKQD